MDMLVRLYDLPPSKKYNLESGSVRVKRAIGPERNLVVSWVNNNFGDLWASECEVAFGNSPSTCFVAFEGQEIVGFSCYNTTAPNYFGPTGVLDDYQGRGIGKILLFESLYALKSLGYQYAIIGGVGPVDFYKKSVGAEVIAGSEKGVYKDLLKSEQKN